MPLESTQKLEKKILLFYLAQETQKEMKELRRNGQKMVRLAIQIPLILSFSFYHVLVKHTLNELETNYIRSL